MHNYLNNAYITINLWDYNEDPVYAEDTDPGNASGWGLNNQWRSIGDALTAIHAGFTFEKSAVEPVHIGVQSAIWVDTSDNMWLANINYLKTGTTRFATLEDLSGLDFQDSVLDKDLVTAPASPGTGDRYIIAGIGGGWSGGTINDIAEWNGTAWVFQSPNKGFVCEVEDESRFYHYNGSAWGPWGSVIYHNALNGKQGGTTDEFYHLTSAEHVSLTGLTASEITQLQNIDTTTISIAQWVILGNANQSLATTDPVTFLSLMFGDGDTGFYESSDDVLVTKIAGGDKWIHTLSFFYSVSSNSASIRNAVPSATLPGFTFVSDPDTGIGTASANQLSLIAGGIEVARLLSTGMNITGNIGVTGTVDGTDISVHVANASAHHVRYALTEDFTTGEITQLQNIDTTTISIAQWGYLGTLNQALATTNDPTFATLNIIGKLTVGGLIDPTGLGLTPVGSNPLGVLKGIWVDSADDTIHYFNGSIDKFLVIGDSPSASVSIDDAYNTGSTVAVDDTNVIWNLATTKSIKHTKTDTSAVNAYPFQWIVEFQTGEYQSVNIRQVNDETVWFEVGESDVNGVMSKGVRLEGKNGALELFDGSTVWFGAYEDRVEIYTGIPLLVDEINEYTTDNGVTIEGLTFEDDGVDKIINNTSLNSDIYFKINDGSEKIIMWFDTSGGAVKLPMNWLFVNNIQNYSGAAVYVDGVECNGGKIKAHLAMIPATSNPFVATYRGFWQNSTLNKPFYFDGGASTQVTLVKDNVDIEITDATKGIILRDTQGTPHKWRVTVDNSGNLVTSDLGVA